MHDQLAKDEHVALQRAPQVRDAYLVQQHKERESLYLCAVPACSSGSKFSDFFSPLSQHALAPLTYALLLCVAAALFVGTVRYTYIYGSLLLLFT